MNYQRALAAAAWLAVIVAVAAAASVPARSALPAGSAPRAALGIHKVRHVIVIMQENRSFDSYFGTYPGADGIPMRNGIPTVCSPNPRTGKCDKPYHDANDKNGGGPHSAANATADVDGGKMDGFVREAETV